MNHDDLAGFYEGLTEYMYSGRSPNKEYVKICKVSGSFGAQEVLGGVSAEKDDAEVVTGGLNPSLSLLIDWTFFSAVL